MNLKRSFRGGAVQLEFLDGSLDSYVHWHEQSRAVEECYRRWTVAVGGERGIAFARYLAALDREERAAGGYERVVDHARQGSDPRPSLVKRPTTTTRAGRRFRARGIYEVV